MTNYLELVKADIPSNRGATGWLCSGGLMVVVVVVPLGVGGRWRGEWLPLTHSRYTKILRTKFHSRN